MELFELQDKCISFMKEICADEMFIDAIGKGELNGIGRDSEFLITTIYFNSMYPLNGWLVKVVQDELDIFNKENNTEFISYIKEYKIEIIVEQEEVNKYLDNA